MMYMEPFTSAESLGLAGLPRARPVSSACLEREYERGGRAMMVRHTELAPYQSNSLSRKSDGDTE